MKTRFHGRSLAAVLLASALVLGALPLGASAYYYGEGYIYDFYDGYGYYEKGERPPVRNQDRRVLHSYSVTAETSLTTDGYSPIRVTIEDANVMGISKIEVQKNEDAADVIEMKPKTDFSRKKSEGTVTLKSSFLQNLKQGDYTATAVFVGGHTASFEFTVDAGFTDDFDEPPTLSE